MYRYRKNADGPFGPDKFRELTKLNLVALVSGIMLIAGVTAPRAQAETSPVFTNQEYIERVRGRAKVDLTKPKEVLKFVLDNLPRSVKVYTGENYYYFKFYTEGIRYAGNIRLDATDRDLGKVHFAYFRDYNEWSGNPKVHYTLFTPKDGVKVTKLKDLTYTVAAGGDPVTFSLNDLKGLNPPEGTIRPDEDYIGPVFDESGVIFFLVYNRTFKTFQYFLDETGFVPDKLVKSEISESVVIGRRTGFAYFIDKYRKRKILIGVHNANANLNNFLDGPFDQLPDNILGDGRLRRAILDASPKLKGQIDIYGNSADGSERYFVGSYLHYTNQSELQIFVDCAAEENLSETLYYGCFSVEDKSDEPPEYLTDSEGETGSGSGSDSGSSSGDGSSSGGGSGTDGGGATGSETDDGSSATDGDDKRSEE